MNAIVVLPLPARLASLAVLGAALGAAANWAIYALAFRPRPISPWQRPHPTAPPRHWSDRLPLVGWLGLARESALHGSGYWLRPLLIEIWSAFGLPWLYWWETTQHLAPHFPPPFVNASPAMLHCQFLAHAILIGFLLVATFIDFDEQTIPDSITTPGTLMGLILIAIAPQALLPVERIVDFQLLTKGYGPLLLTSTDAWPQWLNGWRGVLLGMGLFVSWCLALIPATATLRRGLQKSVQFYFASMIREGTWWPWVLLAAVGSAAIAGVWHVGGEHWQGLLTALVGLAGGGLIVWGVRIAGWVGLRKEAMGFGDVTLMAMMGTYLGWQTCLVIFFFSPVAALFVSVTQWAITGRRDIAFGPYLALTGVVVVIYWRATWELVQFHFQAGLLVPAFFAAGLLLMMGLLMLWRLIEQSIWGEAEREGGTE